jgi:LysR family transcriptional regulator, nitrogen assimilation regulatory protein
MLFTSRILAPKPAATMDLRKIRYFFAVIEHRNLSGAAQALRISQPTLSRHMQALEGQFKTPLFVRSSRGMLPTEAGRRLHEGLQGLERQLQSLQDDVAAAMLEPTGEVAVGIPPSPRSLLAVSLIKRFAKACPRVVVRVIEETSGQLRDLIANGSLDVAITNFHEPMRGVIAKPLGREQMLLVGPPGAKLSRRVPTPMERLADLPLILTTRPNSLRLTVETGLSALGLRPDVRVEANTLPLMTDFVKSGLGYTVLPACGVRTLRRSNTVSVSPIAGFFLTWAVAKPKTRSLGLAAETMYNMVCKIGAEMVSQGVWQQPSRAPTATLCDAGRGRGKRAQIDESIDEWKRNRPRSLAGAERDQSAV